MIGKVQFLRTVIVLTCIMQIDLTVGTESEVRAHVGSTVSLPCRVDTDQCGALHSVKWYRDTSRIYVFSHVGSIARAEGDSPNRMTVEYTKSSVDAKLKISPVKIEDDATYKCEITYLEVRENCDVVQIVKLQTLVKPDSVRIVNGSTGKTVENGTTLEPVDEGTELDLTCEARSGKPVPKVSWFNGSTEVTKAVYTTKDDGDGLGTGQSRLQTILSKGDLLARFECRVESVALDEPTITWITPDVHVRPTAMEVYGVKGHVVQGTDVTLRCDVRGARPAATIQWYNSSVAITNATLQEASPEGEAYVSMHRKLEDDGTFTTKSALHFRVSRWENGKAFHCYAQNEVLDNNNEPSLHSLMVLQVQFPPVIKVAPPNITTTENVNILLLCNYFANPQHLKGVVWAKDGNNLTLTTPKNKYEGGTVENPPLIINNVSRDDMGEYTCWLENSVGAEQSEDSILLNVEYPPSVEVVMEPSTPVKAVDKGNVTLVCNVTSGNPSTLLKVRWLLGSDILKELPECNYTSYDENGNGEGDGGRFCKIDPSILSLERVDEIAAGNYSCQGNNGVEWGPVSEPNELIVYYPPSAARLHHIPSKVVKQGSVTLECTVLHPGRPENITYIWYRGSHQVNDVSSSNLTIPSVTLAHKSNYTCAAENAGGRSANATVYLNVSAPPAFIQNLPPYQGVLYSSENISLTCRIECSPLCSIIWKKDGHRLNTVNNPLYYVEEKQYPPVVHKNDFESIESTLHWNMSAWPNHQLDKSAPNSNYACHSHSNGVGHAVSSTIEIAVDYPPVDVIITPVLVRVSEHHVPDPVKCLAKGHPDLSYVWRRDKSSDILSETDVLQLGPMVRSDADHYVCEAINRRGKDHAKVYFDVRYAPECSISETKRDGNLALVCTAHANPKEVTFKWSLRDSNETLETEYIEHEAYKSYLILDFGSDTSRTYQCRANNTVGEGSPCEIKVTADVPWWKQLTGDKLIILIAASVTLIVCVLIICIIIILLCRRKRANTKSPNPSSTEDKMRLGAAPPVGFLADPSSDPDKGFYENLPFHGMQNPPNKPFKPDNGDLEYADVDYKSYGPINYKAASMYAALKKNKDNKLEEANKPQEDHL